MIFKTEINGDTTSVDGIIIPFEVNVNSYRKSVGEWVQNSIGEWFKVMKIDIIEKNKAEITIEKWDTQQFSPAHSMAYSSMCLQAIQFSGRECGKAIHKAYTNAISNGSLR